MVRAGAQLLNNDIVRRARPLHKRADPSDVRIYWLPKGKRGRLTASFRSHAVLRTDATSAMSDIGAGVAQRVLPVYEDALANAPETVVQCNQDTKLLEYRRPVTLQKREMRIKQALEKRAGELSSSEILSLALCLCDDRRKGRFATHNNKSQLNSLPHRFTCSLLFRGRASCRYTSFFSLSRSCEAMFSTRQLLVASRSAIKRSRGHPSRWPVPPGSRADPLLPEPKFEVQPVQPAASGFIAATGRTPTGLPFSVSRTPTHGIPVYSDYKNGRSRVVTIVRRIQGDTTALKLELGRVLGGARVDERVGRIEVHGNRVDEVKTWLAGLGF